MVQYEKAEAKDYEEIIDLANYTFSASRRPTDFPGILPKLYRREYFMDAVHYIAREDGRIKAIVGSYPLEMRIQTETLPGRGIGMVSVHPYARSRGYMRTLMNMALADIRGASPSGGHAFSCLAGQRQRYEYFGFAPTGTRFVFECGRDNVRHITGRAGAKKPLTLKLLGAEDAELIASIRAMHESKTARFHRPGGRFFDILSSWNSAVYAVLENGGFFGYLIHKKRSNSIHEINLKDFSAIAETLRLFFETSGGENSDTVTVAACTHETEKLFYLSSLAENRSITTAYSYNILDYPRFVSAFIALKTGGQTKQDGSFTLRIMNGGPPHAPGGDTTLHLFAEGGKAGAAQTDGSGHADLTLDHLEAMDFLFSPESPYTRRVIAEQPFLRGLLPLPLFFEYTDGV
ncbi:MAG: GNAT family N-acetyltransferase [Spirochaetaceae bacterium]|jgi:predicted acetyltransferase|nr:GNAT family N-acetyltransferase [Spirochaetaceae bacterium]